MLDFSKFTVLLEGHRYSDAVEEARRLEASSGGALEAVACLAEALLASGDYAAALPLYAQVDAAQRSDAKVGGRSGQRIWISSIFWMLQNQTKAIQLMREMVDGILDGTIEFGDAAGGVQQGLLLYYMGTTAHDERAVSKALSYLRGRAKRRSIELFPGIVARYYLDEVDYAEVLGAATRGKARNVPEAMRVAEVDLLSRRWVCVALFHDGVKGRAAADEGHLRTRMQECVSLMNPLTEPEWYLARYEMAQGSADR